MLRIGEALGSFLWVFGWSGRLVLAAGALGLALSIASALVLFVPPWRGAARRIGVITLIVAATTMGLAGAATWIGRATADEAARSKADPAERAKALHDGYIEARVLSFGGLVFGMFPSIAGAGAAMSGRPAAPSEAPRRSGLGRRERSRVKITRPVVIALAAAILAAILALSGAQAEVPDRELYGVLWYAPPCGGHA